MLTAVYKSSKKNETYLFVNKRDDFSDVPEMLLKQFGTPLLVSILNIKNDTKMAISCPQKVIAELESNGFYLQLPPPPINHLDEHKKRKLKGANNEN